MDTTKLVEVEPAPATALELQKMARDMGSTGYQAIAYDIGAAIVAAIDRLQPAGMAEKLAALAEDHAAITALHQDALENFRAAERERDHLAGEVRTRDLEIEQLKTQVADLQAAVAKGMGNLA